MIKSFKHKGLERLFIKGSASGVQADYAPRITLITGCDRCGGTGEGIGFARLTPAPVEGRKAQPVERESIGQLAYHVRV